MSWSDAMHEQAPPAVGDQVTLKYYSSVVSNREFAEVTQVSITGRVTAIDGHILSFGPDKLIDIESLRLDETANLRIIIEHRASQVA